MSLKKISDEIISLHHSFLRRELPKFSKIIGELLEECDRKNSDLLEAEILFSKLRSKIDAHLYDEEAVLFPIGIAIENGSDPTPAREHNLLKRLEEMEHEHENSLGILDKLISIFEKQIQTDLSKEALVSLRTIQNDLRLHIEKENTKIHPLLKDLIGISK